MQLFLSVPSKASSRLSRTEAELMHPVMPRAERMGDEGQLGVEEIFILGLEFSRTAMIYLPRNTRSW